MKKLFLLQAWSGLLLLVSLYITTDHSHQLPSRFVKCAIVEFKVCIHHITARVVCLLRPRRRTFFSHTIFSRLFAVILFRSCHTFFHEGKKTCTILATISIKLHCIWERGVQTAICYATIDSDEEKGKLIIRNMFQEYNGEFVNTGTW